MRSNEHPQKSAFMGLTHRQGTSDCRLKGSSRLLACVHPTANVGVALLVGCSALDFLMFARPKTSPLDNYHRSAVIHTQVLTDLLLCDPLPTSSAVVHPAVVCCDLCGEVLKAEHSHSVALRP